MKMQPALALALTGIYAVVLYSVGQRAREIGIRIALGASQSSIVRLLMAHGMRFIAIGVGLGIVMAATALMTMPDSVPVTADDAASVAVRDCAPAVRSVALKV